MKIGDRIRNRRKGLGMSAEELGEKLGKNRATIYRYESNDIENLPSAVLEPLAKALYTTPAELMGWVIKENESEYRVVDDKNSIPLIGQIAAGSPILAEENIEYYFEIDRSIKADFALRVKGDSMINAGIFDGDIAFIRKQKMVENGQIAAVVIGEKATLKRFYKKDSSVILQPENKDYEPLIFTDGEMYIAGKLVAVLNLVK